MAINLRSRVRCEVMMGAANDKRGEVPRAAIVRSVQPYSRGEACVSRRHAPRDVSLGGALEVLAHLLLHLTL